MVAASAIALAAIAILVPAGPAPKAEGFVFGAPFRLVDHGGRAITDADLLGHPSLVFFGFTHCPDVCPTTLADMSAIFDELGDEAGELRGYFVTVDPERDTPEVLSEYLGHFSTRITGITGPPAEVAQMLGDHRIFRRRVDLDDGDYTMDHTATVFVLDAKRRLRATIRHGEDIESALAKVRRVLAPPGQ